jgi:Ca2+:H+ antiporter
VTKARKFFLSGSGWPYLLVPFIPIAIALEIGHAEATLIFVAAALGVIPTAALMGRSTEELAARTGPGIGGFLNVTFGNFPELVIAFFALNAGCRRSSRRRSIGSILGNILLVMGAAMFVGGRKRDGSSSTAPRQRPGAHAPAGAAALVLPAVFELIDGGRLPRVGEEEVNFRNEVETMSFIVAFILLGTYAAGLLFSLKTHRSLFNPRTRRDRGGGEAWSIKRSVITLAVAGVAVGLMSEILVGSIIEASEQFGISEFFVGLIVVAIVGNAAEHWVAIYFAAKDKMDLAVNIAIGSSAQIALFVAPVLVLLSFVPGIGDHPMALVFNGYELVAVLLAILVANFVVNEGESTWFEGCSSWRCTRPRRGLLLRMSQDLLDSAS